MMAGKDGDRDAPLVGAESVVATKFVSFMGIFVCELIRFMVLPAFHIFRKVYLPLS